MTAVGTAQSAIVLGLLVCAWFCLAFPSLSCVPSLARWQRLSELARAVAEGDLTQRIEVHSTDEIGQLMQALKDMNDEPGEHRQPGAHRHRHHRHRVEPDCQWQP